jgi:c(7)-type cytochrome triheme protein
LHGNNFRKGGKEMKLATLVVVMLTTLALASAVMAVPPGKSVEFEGGAMGKVTFLGKVHADAGLKCNDCHSAIFKMKKGSTKIAAPHKAGAECFTCHTGERSFNFKDDCTKCHAK